MPYLADVIDINASITSRERTLYWVQYFAHCTSAEQRVIQKITRLAFDTKQHPVHIIMAMVKSATMPGLNHISQCLIEMHIQRKMAVFWANTHTHEQCTAWLNDFWSACRAFTYHITIDSARHRQRIKLVRPKTRGYFQGRAVPFRRVSMPREHVAEFKRAQL